MGYYLAKMVGGNSALLVKISDDIDLQCVTRVKCDCVLNLSMIRCYLLMKEPIPLSVIQNNQFINFAYLKNVEIDCNLLDDLIQFCNLVRHLYDLVGQEFGENIEIKYEKRKDARFGINLYEKNKNKKIDNIQNINVKNEIRTKLEELRKIEFSCEGISQSDTTQLKIATNKKKFSKTEIGNFLEKVANKILTIRKATREIEELGPQIDFIERL